MDLKSVIRNRRTTRRFKPKKIPKSLLKKIFEAARWAPSLHNLQPWRFIVVDGEMKERLIEILGSYQKNEPLFLRLILKGGVKIVKNAPAAILVYKKAIFSKRVKKGGRLYYNKACIGEVQSVACAIQNILLAAYSFGLGTAWIGIAIFREEEINRLFGIEDELMAIIAVGYPAEYPLPPPRKPISEIVSFLNEKKEKCMPKETECF